LGKSVLTNKQKRVMGGEEVNSLESWSYIYGLNRDIYLHWLQGYPE